MAYAARSYDLDHEAYVRELGIAYKYDRFLRKWWLEQCPYCGWQEHGIKRKKVYVFADTGHFRCFMCGEQGGTFRMKKDFQLKSVPDENERRIPVLPKAPVIIDDAEWEGWHSALLKSPSAQEYLQSLGISATTYTKVKLGLTSISGMWAELGEDGSVKESHGDRQCIVYPYFEGGKCTGAKFRNMASVDKSDRFKARTGCRPRLFNADRIVKGRDVIITEGEKDCISIIEMGIDNVVSVPDGCSTWKDEWSEQLDGTKTWYFIFDPDDPGQAGARKHIAHIGNKARNIVLDKTRDINECLLAGFTRDDVNKAILSQRSHGLKVSSRICRGADRVLDVLGRAGDEGAVGVSTGWPHLDDRIMWRKHELTVISGNTGEGKSTFAFLAGLEQAKAGRPTLMVSLEEPTDNMMMKQIGHICGKPYITMDETDKDNCSVSIKKFCETYPMHHYDNDGWLDVDEFIDEMVAEIEANGLRFLIIDHLDFLEAKSAAGEDKLERTKFIMKRLSNLCKCYPIHIFLICHTRKKKEGAKFYTVDDIRGDSDQVKLANNVVFYYRENATGRVLLDIKKQRATGATGNVRLQYNADKVRFE